MRISNNILFAMVVCLLGSFTISSCSSDRVNTPAPTDHLPEKATKAPADDRNSPITSWEQLGITPVKSMEGDVYTFGAFEVMNEHTLAIGGSILENVVEFIDLKTNKITSKIELKETPLDMVLHNGGLYVLGKQALYIIRDNKVAETIPFSIRNIAFYDKMMVFDGKLSVLMSNGSSYVIEGKKLIKKDALMTHDNTGIWIQKSKANAFELISMPENDELIRSHTSDKELGSITLAGGNRANIYVCLEQFTSKNPPVVTRTITSHADNFQKAITNVPNNNYSYVKNNYKIHDNILYYLIINETGIALKKITL